MFIAKKGMNLRRPNGWKLSVKADEVKDKENKPAEKEKNNKQQSKKEATSAENKPEDEAK